MSWFYYVSQGSSQQPSNLMPSNLMPSNLMPSNLMPSNLMPSNLMPSTADTMSSPSMRDFPLPPQGSVPPSLEMLSCCSLNSGASREPMPLSYVTLQEQRCVLSWFLGWGTDQRERFLHDLLGKAVPGKVCTLLDSLSTLQVMDRPPNIFECQLRLWTQWFESWSEEERNAFLHILEERDPMFVAHFYRSVAGTAGKE